MQSAFPNLDLKVKVSSEGVEDDTHSRPEPKKKQRHKVDNWTITS